MPTHDIYLENGAGTGLTVVIIILTQRLGNVNAFFAVRRRKIKNVPKHSGFAEHAKFFCILTGLFLRIEKIGKDIRNLYQTVFRRIKIGDAEPEPPTTSSVFR